MNITFKPLEESHLTLLLKWLETPHVKAWWAVDQSLSVGLDQDKRWTEELIKEKYGTYIEGYKIENGERKEIHAYIMFIDNIEVGYIQYYNAYDFLREQGALTDLPPSLAAIDLFIGKKSYIGKGFGPILMDKFIQDHVFKNFDAVFVDPEIDNKAAVKAYEKCGFKIVRELPDKGIVWMVKKDKKIFKKELSNEI